MLLEGRLNQDLAKSQSQAKEIESLRAEVEKLRANEKDLTGKLVAVKREMDEVGVDM